MSVSETALFCGSLVRERIKERPHVFLRNSFVLCGSLVLLRRKDLMSFSNGPTFSVLVMLRIDMVVCCWRFITAMVL